MATTPEGKVKDKIKKLLKQHGAYFTMPVMTGFATNGTPDFSVCHVGRYLAIEAKDEGKDPTELQWVKLTEVTKSGGSTMVIHQGNMHILEKWLSEGIDVRVVREMDSRRVMHHWTNKGVM